MYCCILIIFVETSSRGLQKVLCICFTVILLLHSLHAIKASIKVLCKLLNDCYVDDYLASISKKEMFEGHQVPKKDWGLFETTGLKVSHFHEWGPGNPLSFTCSLLYLLYWKRSTE